MKFNYKESKIFLEKVKSLWLTSEVEEAAKRRDCGCGAQQECDHAFYYAKRRMLKDFFISYLILMNEIQRLNDKLKSTEEKLLKAQLRIGNDYY